MKNPLLTHPKNKGMTYREHFKIAASIGFRLLLSSTAFLLHAIFPFVPIPNKLNLTKTSKYLREANAELIVKKLNR